MSEETKNCIYIHLHALNKFRQMQFSIKYALHILQINHAVPDR